MLNFAKPVEFSAEPDTRTSVLSSPLGVHSIIKWGALCSQHFEYESNYGHVFPVSFPLAHMRFSVSRPLIRMRDTH